MPLASKFLKYVRQGKYFRALEFISEVTEKYQAVFDKEHKVLTELAMLNKEKLPTRPVIGAGELRALLEYELCLVELTQDDLDKLKFLNSYLADQVGLGHLRLSAYTLFETAIRVKKIQDDGEKTDLKGVLSRLENQLTSIKAIKSFSAEIPDTSESSELSKLLEQANNNMTKEDLKFKDEPLEVPEVKNHIKEMEPSTFKSFKMSLVKYGDKTKVDISKELQELKAIRFGPDFTPKIGPSFAQECVDHLRKGEYYQAAQFIAVLMSRYEKIFKSAGKPIAADELIQLITYELSQTDLNEEDLENLNGLLGYIDLNQALVVGGGPLVFYLSTLRYSMLPVISLKKRAIAESRVAETKEIVDSTSITSYADYKAFNKDDSDFSKAVSKAGVKYGVALPPVERTAESTGLAHPYITQMSDEVFDNFRQDFKLLEKEIRKVKGATYRIDMDSPIIQSELIRRKKYKELAEVVRSRIAVARGELPDNVDKKSVRKSIKDELVKEYLANVIIWEGIQEGKNIQQIAALLTEAIEKAYDDKPTKFQSEVKGLNINDYIRKRIVEISPWEAMESTKDAKEIEEEVENFISKFYPDQEVSEVVKQATGLTISDYIRTEIIKESIKDAVKKGIKDAQKIEEEFTKMIQQAYSESSVLEVVMKAIEEKSVRNNIKDNLGKENLVNILISSARTQKTAQEIENLVKETVQQVYPENPTISKVAGLDLKDFIRKRIVEKDIWEVIEIRELKDAQQIEEEFTKMIQQAYPESLVSEVVVKATGLTISDYIRSKIIEKSINDAIKRGIKDAQQIEEEFTKMIQQAYPESLVSEVVVKATGLTISDYIRSKIIEKSINDAIKRGIKDAQRIEKIVRDTLGKAYPDIAAQDLKGLVQDALNRAYPSNFPAVKAAAAKVAVVILPAVIGAIIGTLLMPGVGTVIGGLIGGGGGAALGLSGVGFYELYRKNAALGTLVTTAGSAGLGAAVGAIIGTLVFPGVGTAIGAALGAGAGAAVSLTGTGLYNLWNKNRAAGTVLTTLGSAGLGAGIGALLGTLVFPGIGTVIGAALGAGVGASVSLVGTGIYNAIKTNQIFGIALTSLGTAGLGAGVGALLGSLVFPGIGTVIGAAIGAGVGAVLPGLAALAIKFWQFIANKPAKKEDKTEPDIKKIENKNVEHSKDNDPFAPANLNVIGSVLPPPNRVVSVESMHVVPPDTSPSRPIEVDEPVGTGVMNHTNDDKQEIPSPQSNSYNGSVISLVQGLQAKATLGEQEFKDDYNPSQDDSTTYKRFFVSQPKPNSTDNDQPKEKKSSRNMLL
ncbi:hypothetical protein ACNVED_13005 [Legionella sp. D16C41]|uniref:DUF456 domain-containing protein n=1 Tax=Legionella sp. D16C41 TaxID=3402688 RepID=UPI003AF50183